MLSPEGRMPPDREELAMAMFDDAITDGQDTKSALAAVIGVYPECAALLADYTLAKAAESRATSLEEDETTARIERRAALIAQRYVPTPAPFTGILAAAKQQGGTIASLSEQLSLARSVVVKLDRRLIDAATIPASLIERIAATVGQSVATVQSYLAAPPSLSAGASYKSAASPELGDKARESFEAALDVAVSSGEMTTAQRDQWLATGDG
jgi:hypothetical protein